MTKEEAIELLERDIHNANVLHHITEHYKMAIKALEQEPTLDKIRAEVESQRKEVSNKHSENDELQAYYHGLNDGLKDARDIIDKYQGKSEG